MQQQVQDRSSQDLSIQEPVIRIQSQPPSYRPCFRSRSALHMSHRFRVRGALLLLASILPRFFSVALVQRAA